MQRSDRGTPLKPFSTGIVDENFRTDAAAIRGRFSLADVLDGLRGFCPPDCKQPARQKCRDRGSGVSWL
jgi:hypothetical protein